MRTQRNNIMSNEYRYILFIILMNSSTYSLKSASFSYESLLFSKDEVQTVYLKRRQELIKDSSCLSCSGYSYVSSTKWCIWINGVALKSLDDFSQYNFTISEACVNGLRLTAQNGKVVLLKPGMTISKTGEIL